MPDEYLRRALSDLAEMYSADTVLTEAHHLFGAAVPSVPSRASDLDTSHASGDRVRTVDVTRFSRSSRCAKLLDAIASHGGLTAQEATNVVMHVGASMSSFDGCRRRVSDLLAARYIEDSGERRSNPGSPDLSVVWRLTMAGARARQHLTATGWSRARVAA